MDMVLRVFFALIFGASGIYHFVKPEFYMPLMPSGLPAHKLLIYLFGLAEIGIAIGLFVGPFRQYAVWGTISLLLVFTPIHIIDYFRDNPAVGSKTVAAIRLLMQAILLTAAAFLL